MAADGLICEGDHLVLDVNGEKLSFVQKIKASGTVRVGKFVVPAAPLIGAPYGSLFEVTDGKRLQRVLLPPPDEITRVMETEKDNSTLFDRNTENQKLKREQIEELKKSGKAGREIIETICSNSATFQNKTEFSQDKYKRRKAKKYLTFVTVRKPTARIVCEAFTDKSPERVWHLRHDSLAVMLSLANVAAGAKVLVVEQCLGVVTAAAVERLGGLGTVCAVQLDELPAPVDAVRQMNLNAAERGVLFTAPVSSLLRDQAAVARGQPKDLSTRQLDDPKQQPPQQQQPAQDAPKVEEMAEPQTEVKAELQTEVKAELQTEVKAEPQTEVKAEPQTEVKAVPQTEVKAVPQTEVKTGRQTEVKEETATDTAPAPAGTTAAGKQAPSPVAMEVDSEAATDAAARRMKGAATVAVDPEEGKGTKSEEADAGAAVAGDRKACAGGDGAEEATLMEAEAEAAGTGVAAKGADASGDPSVQEADQAIVPEQQQALKVPPQPLRGGYGSFLPRPEALLSVLKSGFDSCLVALPRIHPTAVLDVIWPLLAPSATFAVYCPSPQPLAEALMHLQLSRNAVLLQLQESWLRPYQVLPARTHPHMSCSGTGGYVLSGIKVIPTDATPLSLQLQMAVSQPLQSSQLEGPAPPGPAAAKEDAAAAAAGITAAGDGGKATAAASAEGRQQSPNDIGGGYGRFRGRGWGRDRDDSQNGGWRGRGGGGGRGHFDESRGGGRGRGRGRFDENGGGGGRGWCRYEDQGGGRGRWGRGRDGGGRGKRKAEGGEGESPESKRQAQ